MADAIRKAGRRAAAHKANILISTESFHRWLPADFLALGALFGQEEIRIAYVLRDPVSRMCSLWSETVKGGKTHSLVAYSERQLAAPLASAALNCLVELGPVLAEPRLTVTVLDFEQIRKNKGDIFVAFCSDILKVDGVEPATGTVRNERHPLEIYDYLRILTKAGGAEVGKRDILYWRRFLRSHDENDLALIVDTVARIGADSRSLLRFERKAPWFAALDEHARQALEGVIAPPSPRQALFDGPDIEAFSYDVACFESLPEIRARSMPRSRNLRASRSAGAGAALLRSCAPSRGASASD
ncbi:hypothetical protein [Rhizobium sp. FKL33]|uniref:hypothetical protein n=1 Tax=Rhizobium sp. FKL33 TaxID=2562307 RepID=UPI00197FE0DC|nr:hypothetical protein [Rhizobium sp. FKL33]